MILELAGLLASVGFCELGMYSGCPLAMAFDWLRLRANRTFEQRSKDRRSDRNESPPVLAVVHTDCPFASMIGIL